MAKSPLPVPVVRAPREYRVGEIIRLCRFSDGRRRSYATVQGYDASRDVLRLQFGTGECSEVSGTWRAISRDASRRDLPTDALEIVASYLGARRVARFARACRAFKTAACLDGATPAGREAWRARVLARWPYPGGGGDDDDDKKFDWSACYERRVVAERTLQRRCIRERRFRNPGNFAPRLCACPTCLVELGSRSAALQHFTVHKHCWTHLTNDDDKWLAATQAKLDVRRHDDAAAAGTAALWRACKALRRTLRRKKGRGLGLA